MHCLFTIVFSFSATLESEVKPRHPQLYPALKRLCDLFGAPTRSLWFRFFLSFRSSSLFC